MATPLLVNPIAGPFQVSFTLGGGTPNLSADKIGFIGAGGVREIMRIEGEEIPVDLLGNTIVDAVHMGGQCFLEFILEEIGYTQCQKLINPFSNTVGNDLELGVPGTFMSAKAGATKLWPVAGSSAAAQTNLVSGVSGAYRTYDLTSLAPGFEIGKLFSTRRRALPLRMRVFPFLDSGVYRFGRLTTS
jgi:hypothetical protein